MRGVEWAVWVLFYRQQSERMYALASMPASAAFLVRAAFSAAVSFTWRYCSRRDASGFRRTTGRFLVCFMGIY